MVHSYVGVSCILVVTIENGEQHLNEVKVNFKAELDILWLKQRIVKTTASNLTNSTLTDKGGSEHQS